MAMLQLKCPETGKPVDLRKISPDERISPLWFRMGLSLSSLRQEAQVEQRASATSHANAPLLAEATRVLLDDGSATAIP